VPVRVQGTLLDGRYRVLRHLGSGGMASVLLCQDERLDRLVAVKRLHADQPDDIERRFVREAKLGASLNHPNLVSVFDTATDDEGVLIIMEYVQGEPLSRALRRGPLAPERVARMASELGAALDHAHRQGVVHRDVKPGNVLLRDDGVTKLVDLGIATAAGHTRITRTGIVLGTASYMAPEQLEGREVGPAADVYALAAVCFEALAGERARPGGSPMEVAQTIATEPAPDLRGRWAGAPPATAELLERAMARDPGKRPRTAGELGSRLRGTLEEAPQGTAATRRMDRRTAGGAAGSAVPAPSTAARASGRSPTAPNGVSDRGAAHRPPGTLGPPRRGNRSRLLPLALVGALVALAVATIVIAFGSGGGGDPSSQQDGARPAERPRASEQNRKKPKQRAESEQPAPPAEQPEQQAPAAPAPAPAPEEDQPEEEQPAASGPAEGERLNNQGFQLMSEGRYDEAIPILQRAVDSFPPGTSDLNYAYALFNLGQALRLAGRPEEAIPILEQRLEIPNQTGIVRRELELARRAAGRE
jgi:eukaryotic-like serine/threonine-protein kinase